MTGREIDAIRALLTEKPRPVTWQERRERLDEIGAVWPPAPDIATEPVDVGGLPGEWSLAPGSDRERVLLYFHGGGFCSGSIRSHRRLVTEAGRAAGIRTLAIEYRLAPEHPFPSAHDDTLAAWHWLRRQNYAAERIVIGGDSAGGGLTVALANRLRDAGEAMPACLWAISPWTDLAQTGESLATKEAVDPIIGKPYLDGLAAAVVPPGVDRRDPRLSVLYADLRGLPPLLIQVGACETLLDDSVRLARRAGAADVDVTLEIWSQMIHAWSLWNAHLEPGRRALVQAGAFIRRNL
jgi:monoterpene epsilon-lactone hydrolase